MTRSQLPQNQDAKWGNLPIQKAFEHNAETIELRPLSQMTMGALLHKVVTCVLELLLGSEQMVRIPDWGSGQTHVPSASCGHFSQRTKKEKDAVVAAAVLALPGPLVPPCFRGRPPRRDHVLQNPLTISERQRNIGEWIMLAEKAYTEMEWQPRPGLRHILGHEGFCFFYHSSVFPR